ncbi:hypothetical protein [Microvirga subterranea]|uniref:Uncharacterized protein n=1 Tax=Microvirga subterranea TaxID=186651 RepID=A0A370HUU1_9HYPH|nr:hypothetical protein [Microvirga subterranea]RDI60694.1 hypothetical protein DES45_10281 [Microvirga subterranea]
MPLTQAPIVEWPPELRHLLDGASIAANAEGRRYCRLDVDVDDETLLLIHEFEARVRHRQVRLRPHSETECVVGEMNPVIGLGAPADPTRHIGRIRISFHDIQGDDCIDRPSRG